jgi:hypothetical protein
LLANNNNKQKATTKRRAKAGDKMQAIPPLEEATKPDRVWTKNCLIMVMYYIYNILYIICQ